MPLNEKNNIGGGSLMNKKFMQTTVVTLGLTLFTLPLTACNTGTNNYMNPQRTGIIENRNNNQFGSPVRYSTRNNLLKNNNAFDNIDNMKVKSLTIKSQVENLSKIKEAKVVVVGDTAIVAITPGSNTDNPDTLRTAVTERVKSSEPSIKNVLVTESPDMMANINQMFNNMTNRPADEINRDFNKLVKDLSVSNNK